MSYILITGASNNIGKAIALLLAKNGYDIAIHYKESSKNALLLKEEIEKYNVKAITIFGDFSNKEGVDIFIALVKRNIKKLKGFINNASIYKQGALTDTSYNELKDIFQVNMFSPFHLINSFYKCGLLERNGNIINLGMCGLLTKMADMHASAFQMSKLSLLMLTKSFALSLAKDNIRVNMVSPGYSETSVDLPSNIDNLPLKRAATNDEIAEAVLFLIRHQYITGENLEVAGGVRL